MAHGEINHIEFPADNTDRAKAFYGAVAGWEFGEMDGFPNYYMFRSAEGYGGAIGKRDEATGHVLRIYITVDSIDDALAASTANGGTTKEAKSEIPGMGWFAVVIDPEGSEVGLFQGRAGQLNPARVRLIDSHCHLNAERFAGEEVAVLERARAAGVERILVPGWNVASSERAIGLVESFDWLDGAVGVHPHDAAKVDDAGWRRIVELAAHPKVVAIGETGLDYDRVFSPIADQLLNLRRNLRLALDTGKPAVLHVRSGAGRGDAQDAILAELRAAGFGGQGVPAAFGAGRAPAVIHSFSGSVDYARQVLDLGLAISISGLAFRKGEESTAHVVPLVPADRLLVETDSPFLSPPGAPRGRNEPEWVRITAAWVAEGRSEDRVAAGDALVGAYDAFVGRAAVREALQA